MTSIHWLVVLLLGSSMLPARSARAESPVGERIAPLRLPTIDGKTMALHDFRGKKVLLIEFASW